MRRGEISDAGGAARSASLKPPPRRIWRRYAAFVAGYRHWLLVAGLLVTALCGAGLAQLRINADYRAFLDPADPRLLALDAFEKVYSHNEQVLIVVAPVGGDVFTSRALGLIRKLTEAAWRLPFAVRVDSLTNFQDSQAAGDELIIAPLVGGDALDAKEIARIRKVALNSPALRGRLVSPHGDVGAVSVRFNFERAPPEHAEQVAAAVRALTARVTGGARDVRIHLTGNVLLDAAFPEATMADLRTLVPLMYLVIAISLVVFLRSWRGAALTLGVVGFSALSALGIAGWFGLPITAASADAPTIIMTIAIADCVHLLTGYLSARGTGHAVVDAIADSIDANFWPITVTSLTTLVGFLSLNFSDSPAFRGLGNITATGVALAYVYTVLTIPALLAYGSWRGPVHGSAGTAAALRSFAGWVIRHRRAVLVAGGVAVLAAAFMLPRITINDRFVDYFDKSIPFRQDTEFVMSHLTGIYRIHYSLDSGAANGVHDPAYLKRVDAFAQWLRAQPGVIHVDAVTELLKRLNRNLHGDDPRWYRLPEERTQAAQYLLVYQMSVPYGLDLNDTVSVDGRASRVTVTLGNLDNLSLKALTKRADRWLVAHTPAPMHAQAVGTPLIFAYLAERNSRAMLRGSGVAFILIALIVTISLRDLRIGLLSLIPNLVPALLAFGIWGMLVGEVGLALSVVTAMTLGIVVDDTVHFLGNYLRARKGMGESREFAVRYAFARVGRPMVYTSVILVLGFAVLASSSYAINQGLGELTALIILVALVADFTLLPALLLRRESGERLTR